MPSSSSDHTGMFQRASAVARRAPGSASGTSAAIARGQDRERAECPAPQTELGEQSAGGRTDQRADAPHRRHQRRRPGPQPLRQSRIDHRIAESGQQSAGAALHHATGQQHLHASAPARTRRCPTRTRRAPIRYADRGPNRASSALTVVAATTDATRYTVVTQAYSRWPPMSATALGSRLMVRNSLVAYSADTTGEHGRGAQVLRAQQVPPATHPAVAVSSRSLTAPP